MLRDTESLLESNPRESTDVLVLHGSEARDACGASRSTIPIGAKVDFIQLAYIVPRVRSSDKESQERGLYAGI